MECNNIVTTNWKERAEAGALTCVTGLRESGISQNSGFAVKRITYFGDRLITVFGDMRFQLLCQNGFKSKKANIIIN